MPNRPDIISKNKEERTCILIHVAKPADRNVMQKETEKKINTKFMYRDTTNVKYEIYDYAGNNCSHQNSNEKIKKKTWKPCQENIRYILYKRQLY
jgi:hypothetical protein